MLIAIFNREYTEYLEVDSLLSGEKTITYIHKKERYEVSKGSGVAIVFSNGTLRPIRDMQA